MAFRVYGILVAMSLVFTFIGARKPPSNGVPRIRIPDYAGPFKVVVKQVVMCPNEMLGRNVHIVHGIISQTREKAGSRFHGFFESQEPLDDSIQMRTVIASWNTVSGWIPNAFHMRFLKLCSDVKTYFRSLIDLMDSYSADGKKLCPRKASNFTVVGMPVVFVPTSKITVFPYGRWRGDFSFHSNNEVVGCTRFFFDTEPLLSHNRSGTISTT